MNIINSFVINLCDIAYDDNAYSKNPENRGSRLTINAASPTFKLFKILENCESVYTCKDND